MPKTSTSSTTTPNLEKTIAEIRERAARDAEAAARAVLVPRARGTRDDVFADLASRIEYVLRGPDAPITLVGLAKELRESAGRVGDELKKLARAGRVFNVGSDVDPRWIWIVGDDATTEDLAAAVERMIRDRPMTFGELTAATGARRGRLSGVIVQMQRDGKKLRNVGGTERSFRWFLSR